ARKRAAPSRARATPPNLSRSGSPADKQRPKPTGRDEVIEAIIQATVELCAVGGPSEVSLRKVAERAHVNYGLVYRHFGTKSEVVKAAMAH
ncbi:unnamed protein product, partial [Phaeothamnion confervicola]